MLATYMQDTVTATTPGTVDKWGEITAGVDTTLKVRIEWKTLTNRGTSGDDLIYDAILHIGPDYTPSLATVFQLPGETDTRRTVRVVRLQVFGRVKGWQVYIR